MLVDGVLQPVTRVMTYNDAGQRLSETDPEGRRTTYDYYPGDDPDGDGVIVPGATDTAHDGYVKSVHLAAGTPDETTETIVYDPAGNPTSLTDARGSTTHFEFDAQNRLVRTTSPAPFLDQVVVHYDATGRLLTLDVENKDQAGNPVASNPWFTTNWSYDALGRLSTVTREIDETHTAATTFDYDLAGHVTQITKPEGNRETYEYDERGLLYRATLGAGASSASAFGFDYDANGNRSIVRDPLNHATTYAWDDFDRLSVVTNGLGVQTSLTYDDESNLVSTQAKDASAILLSETDYAFDNFDRVSSVTRAILDGSGAVTGNLVSSFVYDRTGNVIRETGGGGRQLTYDYDSLGRFLDARDSIGNRVTNAYDSGGNVIQQTFVDIDTQSGSPTTTTGPLAVYDEMNRLRSSIDVTGSQSTFGYDSRSNLASMHDPDGRTVAYVWDGLNRVRSTTQSSVSGGLSVAENALYDLNGRPTEFVDGLGNRTHFVYDEQDRVAGTTLGYQTGVDASYAYTYDADGNVKSVSFPSGRTTTYGYDILDRLITRAAGTLSETFGYDSRNRIASASARDGGTVTSSVTIAYDSLDQITSETQDGLPVLTAYDGDGYRTHLTYPGGLALTEEHAPNGELTGVRDGAGRSLLANDFRGLGRVTRESYGNLSKTLTTFDSIGRLDSRTHLTSGNATMKSAGYAYDRSGNQLLARRSENAGGGDVFHYDVLSRLTQEWHGASAVDLQNIIDAVSAGAPAPNPQVYSSSTSYTLDSAGNRTASVDAGGTHVYTPNPLNEYGVAAGAPQSYDPDGNLISDATFLYHYDALGRMSGVDRLSDGTPLATYRYDALGRRIGKQTATTNVRYVYDGARLIQERDSSGSVLAEYAYGRGLDDVFLMKRAGHEFYYHKDSLGSVSAVSGDGGTLAESYTYDAFGRVSAYDATGHAIAATGIGNPWMYAGRQYDEETGTYYNRFRPYAPAAGRFLARDPLGSTDGLNLYQYGGGNPTNWTDPWGLERIADLDNLRALSDLSKYDPGFRHRFLDAIQDGSSIEPLIAAQIPRAEKLRHEAEAEIAKIMDQIKQANPPHKSIDDFLPPLRDPRKEQRPTVGPVGSLHGPIKPPRRSDQQEPFDKLMDEIKDKMVDKLIKEPIRDTVIHAIPVVADDAVDVLLHAANPPGVPKALKSEGLINFLRRVKFKVIPAWDAARIIASIEKANAVMDVCSVILEMQGDGKPHFQVVRDQISDLLSEIQEFSSADRNLILGTYDSEELESYIFEGTNSREEWLRRLRHLPPQNPFAK
jgi:RHS repeat-associated protein